jgi:hypothetical protein
MKMMICFIYIIEFICGMFSDCQCLRLYRVSQEERSIFWEVIVSVIRSKNVYMYMYVCPIPNGFRG